MSFPALIPEPSPYSSLNPLPTLPPAGEIGIDDALVMETKEEIFEMNNGCICCTGTGGGGERGAGWVR